jgi:hypothetical protein
MRFRWKPGPAAEADGQLLVSFTEFTFERFRDLPGIALAGTRLRRRLAALEGAVGVSLYMHPLARRGGSVSVWRTEADLRRFVTLPYHVKIMRTYRGRGALRSASWESTDFSLPQAYAEGPGRAVPNGPGG